MACWLLLLIQAHRSSYSASDVDQWVWFLHLFDLLRNDWLRLSAKQIRLSESLLCKITQNLPRAEEDDTNVENLGGATVLHVGAGWGEGGINLPL